MKKKAIGLSLLVGACFCLGGCNLIGSSNTNSGTKKQDNTQTSEDKQQTNVMVPEEGTPQSWLDLFTFDNVTIVLKNNITIKRGNEYRCVGGKWYIKSQDEENFVQHNGKDIFDLYLCNYSKFTFNEEGSFYRASGWNADNSGYSREVTIMIDSGKITRIDDIATQNSSTITTELVFSNYGETVLEN